MSLRDKIIRAIAKTLYGIGDDEPNLATGHIVIRESTEVLDAVLDCLLEHTDEWESEAGGGIKGSGADRSYVVVDVPDLLSVLREPTR